MIVIVELLQTQGLAFYLLLAIVGLMAGSFLTVVINRYPVLLKQQWRDECRDFLGLPVAKRHTTPTIIAPRSHCLQCNIPIKIWCNIPIISYILLRGKCHHCKKPIGLFYPLIELLTAMLSVVIAWRFGFSWQLLCALLFTYLLLALTFIDIRHQLLPDFITLAALWIGLMLNSIGLFTSLSDAVWASVIGYSALWLLSWMFLTLRKKQGMGHGDFKMLAMIGAWLGFYSMINTLLLAIIIGTFSGIILMFYKKLSWGKAIPFGPFLAIGAWVSLLFGDIMIDFVRFF